MTKAITLWQPWATLVAIGAKEYETRSWSTNYRGPLAIHAAKTKDHLDLGFENPFMREALRKYGIRSTEQFPLGAILAVVELVDCLPVEKLRVTALPNERLRIEDHERAFGDFSAGRFAWKLQMGYRFFKPIPARGRQGLWNWYQP